MHRLLCRFASRVILMVSLALAGLRWLLIGWFPDLLPVLALSQLLHAASFGSFHASAIHMITATSGEGTRGGDRRSTPASASAQAVRQEPLPAASSGSTGGNLPRILWPPSWHYWGPWWCGAR